jgi:glycosyltransferase involved in cell wall biosynthesis
MKKVSMIIRAYNRLEWTIETLSSIISTTDYDNYEIIIVNNNSKDGTTEWLEWVKDNSEFYASKIKHIKMDKNLGDWYGMVEGLKHVSEDSEYVMQVDNDVLVSDREWLNKLVYTIEKTDNHMAMLKRDGIDMRYELKPKNGIRNIPYKDQMLEICDVERPVCCYIIRKDDFKKFTEKYNGIEGRESKYTLLKEFGFTTKIRNVTCFTYINKGKYIHTNKNVREFI